MADTDDTVGDKCASCSNAPTGLMRRSKCQSVYYCNRNCQKAHWKTHNKVCASPGASTTLFTSTSSTPNPTAKSLDTVIPNPFTLLSTRTWLHDRSKRDTYKLLIDTYRLRMKDDYTFDGDVEEDCILSGMVSSSIRGFTRFLRVIHRRAPDLLPPWWNAAKEQACKQAGGRSGAWESLRRAAEKADIIEHYGDARMPMQLRMFAEAIYGRGPGGQNGETMLDQMVAAEKGDLFAETFDTGALLAGLMGGR